MLFLFEKKYKNSYFALFILPLFKKVMATHNIRLLFLLLCGLLTSDSIHIQAKEKSWKLIFYDDFNSVVFFRSKYSHSKVKIELVYWKCR